jgi:hypothetical protein
MDVTVLRLREGGAPVPRWQFGRLPRLRGSMEIANERDAGRTVVVARLLGVLEPGTSPPDLYEPVIVHMTDDMFVLKGVEQYGEAQVVQSWWVRVGHHEDPSSIV